MPVGRCGPRALTALAWARTPLQHMKNVTFQMEASVAQQEKEFQNPKYIFHNFMERLWALLTIQQQLEQRRVTLTLAGHCSGSHTTPLSLLVVGQAYLAQALYQVRMRCYVQTLHSPKRTQKKGRRKGCCQDTQGPPELSCLQPTGFQHQVPN